MEVSDLIEHIRERVLRDAPAPFLFSDDEIVAYINEGLSKFCRGTHSLIDRFVVQLDEGVSTYDLPESTIHVRHVTTPAGVPLQPITRRHPLPERTGRPRVYTADVATGKFRVYPAPNEDTELELDVALMHEEVEDGDDIHLDPDHALLLAQWVAYRCLQNNDPDGSNTIAAEPFLASWLDGVRNAKMEFQHLRMGDVLTAQPRSWT